MKHEKPRLEQTIENAIGNERKASSKHETKRALIGVFVVIPAIVVAVVAMWFINRIMQGG